MNRVELDILRLLAEMPFPDRLEVVGSVRMVQGCGVPGPSNRLNGRDLPSRCHTQLRLSSRPAAIASLLPVFTSWPSRMVSAWMISCAHSRSPSSGEGSCWSVSTPWPLYIGSPRRYPGVSHPIGIRWYRAMPIDAAIQLPDGRVHLRGPPGPDHGQDGVLQEALEAPAHSTALCCSSPGTR